MDKIITLFVYGSFKRSFPKHHHLLNKAAKFEGSAITKFKYPLVEDLSKDRVFHSPCLLFGVMNQGHHVPGELYNLYKRDIQELDYMLDPYKRLPVELKGNRDHKIAFAYFNVDRNSITKYLDEREWLDVYN